ncbi:hypothetical protein SASPL_157480 [Salvia splendens]|uniref:Uncharacterized protein n=1 Tax=Salvia splendens TaxID=180675 RepID=A0A8X8VUW6_SALSN|nr:hypothetical protein SASPL_157480 [Salvia splendens]
MAARRILSLIAAKYAQNPLPRASRTMAIMVKNMGKETVVEVLGVIVAAICCSSPDSVEIVWSVVYSLLSSFLVHYRVMYGSAQ